MTDTRVNLNCACGHSTGHNCTLDWSAGKYLQPSAPGRHTADSISDPALHRLYDERDMYARDWNAAITRAEAYKAAWHSARERARGRRAAEGAIARAHAELDVIAADALAPRAVIQRIRAALDTEEPRP